MKQVPNAAVICVPATCSFAAEMESMKQAHARELTHVRESYAELIQKKQWENNRLVDQVNRLTGRGGRV